MQETHDPRRNRIARELRGRIEGEVRFDPTSRLLYSTDASIYQIEPVGVVIPRRIEDVQITLEIASAERIPVLPRGAGTSLSGQAIGPAIIIDFSKYLNRIIDIDLQRRQARVQPGVVLDQLNAAVAPYDLQFGPDVATSNRANLGGMIGNNSAGARSIVYGKTVDHVAELNVLFADATAAHFEALASDDWRQRMSRRGREGAVYTTIDKLARRHAEEILRRFPRILRRVSGYNLDAFLGCDAPRSPAAQPAPSGSELAHDAAAAAWVDPGSRWHNGLNLAQLIVGSEGTLALVTEAVLRLVPRPSARGLVMVHYDRMEDALESLGTILACRPSAVELIDRMVLELAAQNLEAARQLQFVRGRPDAVLMVEFSAAGARELSDQIEAFEASIRRRPGVGECVRALEPALRDGIWKMRSTGAALLMGIPGARKPIAFVEDTAVAPERLPEFVRRFQAILAQHHTRGSFYGHASVGCLHIRPLLDIKNPDDVRHMRQIAEEVADLVLEFGGAMSGEHGDGLARSMWNAKLFGPALYEAFQQIKAAFDPLGILNPGKIVHAPDMRENLRYREDYRSAEPETVLDFSRQGGILAAAELCNGAGACRKLHSGTMCPSYMVTREEEHTTRGRANALRAAFSGSLPADRLADPRLFQVLDLCLMCKGCKAECPSNVDLAKLKAEFLHHYYQHHPIPLGSWLLAHVHWLNQAGAIAPRFSNTFLRSRGMKWLLERLAGIDRRRDLPQLALEPIAAWWRKRQRRTMNDPATRGAELTVTAPMNGRVVLFDDCFTSYNEPRVAQAAIRLLERAGYQVELAGVGCCGRALISKGFLRRARSLAQANVAALAERVNKDVPLLGCEPSCLLTFTDEYREMRLGAGAEQVASAAHLVEDWLAAVVRDGRAQLDFRQRDVEVLLHGHCHQKALAGTAGTQAALRLVPGLQVEPLDVGCCGMAGSFGYEREHYDLSCAIAERGLLAAVREQPQATIVASGFSCRSQLWDLAGRRALHPVELLAEQLV